MKQSIYKFCHTCENGLFLLDMPTGFGKTYSVLDFIADYYASPEFADTKFFFITTLKKNLPDEQLRKHFAKRGNEQAFDNICLRLKANYEGVIDKLSSISKKIPSSVKGRTEYKNLLNSVRVIDQYKKNLDSGKSDENTAILYKNAEAVVRNQQEPEFREKVIKPFLKSFKTATEKLKAIQNEPEYQWIGELYPSVYTREKRIFFMSMDKFILGNTTIIEPTYSFYNHKIIDNSIIFIDEFDATKDNMLNQIIKKGLDNYVDYLTLFKQIQASLATREFPASLTTDSKKQCEYLNEHPRSKTCQEIIDGFSNVVQETYDNYSMQYSFRTDNGQNEDNGRNFIFNDLQFHSVLSGDNSFVQIKTDERAKQNWLKFVKRRPTEQDSGILGLLSSVKGCITYFQNGCRNLAYNYKQLKTERNNPLDDDFTLENSITSVLREFHLSREYQRYLTPIILSGRVRSKKDKKGSDGKLSLKYFDRSVYDRGFRYYDFIDDPNHDMQSEIQLFDFQNSPEKILIKMAERARVIGISATATLDTVIGNFDLDYLKRMLEKKYYTDEDNTRLLEKFSMITKNYDKISIHVNSVSFENGNLELELQQIFANPALIKKYKEKIETKFSDKKYAANTFIKIIKAMKDFIVNNEVRSFLCLTNKLAQENKAIYDLKLLKEFADEIIKENQISGLNGENLVYNLTGDEYDFKYKGMVERLSKGEKLFVVSSYNTVGAGQNLQYITPSMVDVVTVNDYPNEKKEKDFDCIFLEKPTNLLVNVDIKKGINSEDLIRYIYQMEFLMERGEISRNDGVACIKSAFMCYSGSNGSDGGIRNKGKPYDTLSVNNYAIRILIQAVGRICRTSLKNKDIFIYVDDEIFKNYDLSKVGNRMLNPEFVKIIEAGKQYSDTSKMNGYDELTILENAAGQLSAKTMQIINELMNFRTEDHFDYWKGLRKLALMRPTMNKKEVEDIDGNIKYQLLYMKAPAEINSYSYEQESDFNKNINIKFDNSLSQKMSEEEVRLQEILSIDGLREHFEKKRYATSFLKNEYLLTPPMFNNIYKGALGEVVGKFILERYLNANLYEMPNELFEKFDFTLGNGIFIDFKYWKDTMIVDATEEKKKILFKLNECKGKRAVVINILNSGKYDKIIPSCNGRIIEVPGLYRLDTHCIDTDMLIKMEGYLR